MNILYVTSSKFKYNIISPDAGPQIADEYKFAYAPIEDALQIEADIFVIDNRMTRDEADQVDILIKSNRVTVLRLVDPSPLGGDDWWYRYCLHNVDFNSVHYMTTYNPVGFVAKIWASARKSKFVFAPFTYDRSKEHQINHKQRLNKVVVTGKRDAHLYPVRERIFQSIQFGPLSICSDLIPHPGYPDVGMKQSHNILGERFIDHLSRYSTASVCSAIYRVEVQKYREIAYAGAAPIGDLPHTLTDYGNHIHIPWRRNHFALALKISDPEYTSEIANSFRNVMRSLRDNAAMVKSVHEAISAL
jgi:hypothetical protein